MYICRVLGLLLIQSKSIHKKSKQRFRARLPFFHHCSVTDLGISEAPVRRHSDNKKIMESGGACRRSLSINNRSFRLRCPSLNSVRLRRIFDLFDKNSDGTITVAELSQALALLGLDADLSDLQAIVQSHIKPGNLGLEFDDFEALHLSLNDTYFFNVEEELKGEMAEQSKLSQEESDLTEAFKVFDEDGDGYISAQELQVVLGKLGLAEGREIGRVEQMITSVDRNHDGRVDFFEFKDMMRSVVVRSS